MKVFGHYVLGSRLRLFVAEQAAASVLFLAAVAARGQSGPRAVLMAGACALSLQGAVYFADLYETSDEWNDARWLTAAGIGVLVSMLLWGATGGGAPGIALATSGLALIVMALLRQIALTQPRRAIVLGSGVLARSVASIREALADCTVIGYVADAQPEVAGPTPLPLLLDRGEVDAVARHMKADLIVVASEGPLPEEALARARASGVDVMSAAGFASRYARNLPPPLLGSSELVYGEGFAASWLTEGGQRALDIVVALSLLALASPLLVLSMIAIRLDSPGSVFYSQERVGRRGVPFLITKLRTMRYDAERGGPVWAAKNDGRVTRVGRILRKARIDELPQIFAVLRGDMSMVGPRPERPYFVEQLKPQVALYGLREVVKPGVTGWAQIRYPYGASVEDARRKLEYDLYYIRHRSLFLNLNILFHTARTVLTGKGAL